MNDEQFEAAMDYLGDEGQVSIAQQLRARDAAQREAIGAWKAAHAREATALAQAWEQRDAAQAQLAQLQAEMPDLRANMTKALDLLQVLTSTKYTDRAFVEAVDEADEMLEQLRGRVVLEGVAEQQGAQGAQAGDERELFNRAYEEICNRPITIREIARRMWMARAALATQPVAIKLPDIKRYNGMGSTAENLASAAWNQCLDAVEKLNAAPSMRAHGDGGADHA